MVFNYLLFIFYFLALEENYKKIQKIQEVLEKHTKMFFWFAENAEI